jgi:hypothetical protein
MSSQYSASTLDVNVSYNGAIIPTEIYNIVWNGDNFTGQIDGISISGVDNNGQIAGSGTYMGQNISASGVVSGWN